MADQPQRDIYTRARGKEAYYDGIFDLTLKTATKNVVQIQQAGNQRIADIVARPISAPPVERPWWQRLLGIGDD